MSDNNKTKFRIVVDEIPNGWWSFGVCLSHANDETYVFVNFFKWCISIGFLYE